MSNALHDQARGTMLEEAPFEADLHRLASYHDVEGVLSLYLDVDPATAQREGFEAALLSAWKPLFVRITDPRLRGRLEYEIAGATSEVRGWRQAPGRSVAMFFSGPGGLREIIPLAFPMRTLARFDPRPVLGPLIAALDEHRRYCVVMFDAAQARLLTVFLGAIEEDTRLESDVPPRTDVGGWGGYLQPRYGRHREHHLAEHARRTVEHLWAIDRSRPVHSLILAGPPEAVSVLRRALPRRLGRLIAAVTSIDMRTEPSDVLAHVVAHDLDMREREDTELVARLVDEAAAGGNATLGWDETLQALGEGRVHMLVLPDAEARPGVVCASEHFLALSNSGPCPLCGAATIPVEDTVETAIRIALHTDSLVHFLSPRAARLLESRGAAAELRF